MKKLVLVLSISLFLALVSTVVAYPHVGGTKDLDQNLYYPIDGNYGQYYVYRDNTSFPGYINLSYEANSSIVYINATNIKKIDIDMPSLFENHSSEVWYDLNISGLEGWFVDNEPYKAVIIGDSLEEFKLRDINEPSHVTLNGTPIDFSYSGGDVTVNLSGYNMSNVEVMVYFTDESYWIDVLFSVSVSVIIVFLVIWIVKWSIWEVWLEGLRGDKR